MKLKYYLRGLGTGIVVTALILGISYGLSGDKTMTDEEVLARAKQLGWSESTVLSELTSTSETDNQEDNQTSADTTDVADDTNKEVGTDTADVKEDIETEDSADVTEDADAENLTDVTEDAEAEDSADVTDDVEIADLTDEAIGESESVEDDPENDDSDNEKQNTNDNSGVDEFGMPDEAGTVTITIVRGDSSDSVSRMLEEAGLVDSATAYDKYLCQNGYDKSIRTGKFEIPADATGEEIAKLITGR